MNGLALRAYHALPAPIRAAAASLRGLYLRWWRYGPESERLMREGLEREHWSRGRWRAWQEQRLVEVLHRAATRVPYYRELWTARRRRGDRRSWELLENWPVLEKESVRRDPRAFLADDCDPRRMLPDHTSGTTGTPLQVWRSRRTVRALYALAAARTRQWHGVSRDDRWAMLGGQLVTPVATRRPPFWVWNGALRQLYMSSYHLAPDLLPHYLDALVEYRVAYLFGYTSSICALAEEALRSGWNEQAMSVAVTSGEPVARHQRAAITAAFRCPVRETYGMTETVAAASECEAGGLHLWPEVGWVELFDGGAPAAPGAGGELVCTGLLNRDMPLIRYRVGDRAHLPPPDPPCRCGRSLPLLGGLDGRVNDLLVTRDGRRVAWLNPVFYGLPLRQAQIIQETVDRLRVRYAPSHGFTADAGGELVERLRSRMGQLEVILEEVTELPRGPGGKLRPVVCRVPDPARDAASATDTHAI